ncbi:MAG: hypothetical protein AAF624_12245 [Bacteroidota bacterium]
MRVVFAAALLLFVTGCADPDPDLTALAQSMPTPPYPLESASVEDMRAWLQWEGELQDEVTPDGVDAVEAEANEALSWSTFHRERGDEEVADAYLRVAYLLGSPRAELAYVRRLLSGAHGDVPAEARQARLRTEHAGASVKLDRATVVEVVSDRTVRVSIQDAELVVVLAASGGAVAPGDGLTLVASIVPTSWAPDLTELTLSADERSAIGDAEVFLHARPDGLSVPQSGFSSIALG